MGELVQEVQRLKIGIEADQTIIIRLESESLESKIQLEALEGEFTTFQLENTNVRPSPPFLSFFLPSR